MKKRAPILILFLLAMVLVSGNLSAQCSICTKTAQQLGEKPAKALNTGIMYLAFTPLAIACFIGYQWRKHNRDSW